jgi:hypothetical protein
MPDSIDIFYTAALADNANIHGGDCVLILIAEIATRSSSWYWVVQFP